MARAHAGAVLSHWSTLMENFHTAALDFYERVELAIARRDLPDVKTSRVEYNESGILSMGREYLRVERGPHVFDLCAAPFGQGYFFSSWLSEKRPGLLAALAFVVVYFALLLVVWAMVGIVFRIVGLDGLSGAIMVMFVMFFLIPFVLAYLAELWGPEKVVPLPLVGPLYAWIVSPATYYKLDTALMFQKSVHNAVMEVLDELTTAKGIRRLSQEERKPILAALLNQAA